MNFLKSLGIGLVIIILSPLLLAGAAVVGVILLIFWIVVFFRGTIRFFKGDSFFKPLEEDITVEKIKAKELDQLNGAEQQQQPQPQQPTPQNIYVTNYYQYPGQGQPPQPAPQPQPQPINTQATERPTNHPDYIEENAQTQEISCQPSGNENDPVQIDIINEEGGNK